MKKNKNLLSVLIILSIIAIILIGGIFFLFKVLKSKNQNISELNNRLTSEVSTGDYVISTQRLLQNLDRDINKIRNSVISSSGDVEFIEDIEIIAKSNGLTIDIDSLLIENDPKISSSTISVLRIKAKTKGSWLSTYKFVSELESLPYKIKINSLLLTNVPGDIILQNKKPVGMKNYWMTSFDMSVLKYK